MSRPPRTALERVLGIEPGDGRPLAWIGLAAFFLNAGAVLAWVALTGRFLGRLGGERMPLVYMALNLLTATMFLAMAARGGRRGRGGIRVLAPVASAAYLALVLLPDPARTAPLTIGVAFVAAWMYTIVGEQQLWARVAELLPLRVAKRLTPGVGALGTTGRVLGAFLATDPLGWNSISSLLVVAAGLNALLLPCLGRARAAMGEAAAPPSPDADEASGSEVDAQPPPTLAEGFRYVRDTPLLRRIALLCFALGLFMGTADYPLAVTAERQFPREELLAAFFGAFAVVSNLSSVLLQFVGTGRLVRHLPLATTLALLPGALAVLGLGGWLAPSFYLAVLVRYCQRIGARVVHTPACLMLLAPVPARHATAARALAFGLAISVGMLTAGVGLQLAVVAEVPLDSIFLGMAVVGLAAIFAARGADEAYLEALLSATRVAVGEDDRARARRAAAEHAGGGPVLELLLTSEDELVREAAEATLAEARGRSARFQGELARRLLDAGEPVALAALESIARSHLPGPLPARLAEALLAAEDPSVAARAARAVGSLADPALLEGVRGRLVDGSTEDPLAPRLAAALLRMARHREDVELGVGVLRRALRSEREPVRAAAVGALGSLGMPVFRRTMTAALQDPGAEVRLAAARALGRARVAGSLPAVLEALEEARDGELRTALLEAADRIQNRTLDEVAHLLDALDERERKRLARAVGAMGGGRSLALLVKALHVRRAPARAALVGSLRAAGDGRFLEVLEGALEGTGPEDPRVTHIEPFLRFIRDRRLPVPHPVYELLARVFEEDQAGEIEAFLRRGLVGAEPDDTGDSTPGVDEARGPGVAAPGDPVAERERLATACYLVGVAAGDPAPFLAALERIEAGDERAASEALELVEAGVTDRALGEALVAALERWRRAQRGDPAAPAPS